MQFLGVCILIVSTLYLILHPSPIFAQENVHIPRVLFIGFDPTDSSGVSLADTYFSNAFEGKTAKEFEPIFAQRTKDAFKELSEGRINYNIVGHMRITNFPVYPDGFTFDVENYKSCVYGSPDFDATTCDNRKWTFPYENWLTEHNICEEINRLNVDELWILSNPYVAAYESFMVGPEEGFDVNGPSFTVPACKKQVIAVNGIYERPEPFLHSYGHRIEAVMKYVMTNWTDTDKEKYWERFAALSASTRSSGEPYCGNTHYPFNAEVDYEYEKTTLQENSCRDFVNFPDYTNEIRIETCEVFGCSDFGWQKFWFSNIPHSEGAFEMTSSLGKTFTMKKDWWNYILYPENAIDFVNRSSWYYIAEEDLLVPSEENHYGSVWILFSIVNFFQSLPLKIGDFLFR